MRLTAWGQREGIEQAARFVLHQVQGLLYGQETGLCHLHDVAEDLTIIGGAEEDLGITILRGHPGNGGERYQVLRCDAELLLPP